jgi:EamA-like transporter family
MVAGSLLLLPIALPSLASQGFRRVGVAGWGSLAYAVILTGVVTNLLYFTGIGRVGPSRAAVFAYLQSFLGVLFAVGLLGERAVPIQIAGGLVVIASVILSRSHPRPARHRERGRAVPVPASATALSGAPAGAPVPMPSAGAASTVLPGSDQPSGSPDADSER